MTLAMQHVNRGPNGSNRGRKPKIKYTCTYPTGPYKGCNSQANGNYQEAKRASKRPDLKALKKMQESGAVLYREKMIGHLPGIEVGDQFYSRAEMVALGIHSHWLKGIDYMGMEYQDEVILFE